MFRHGWIQRPMQAVVALQLGENRDGWQKLRPLLRGWHVKQKENGQFRSIGDTRKEFTALVLREDEGQATANQPTNQSFIGALL